MKSKHTLRIIFIMLALFMGVASEVWADGILQSNIIFDPANPAGGTVVVKSVDNTTRTVTITVTPDQSHFIKRDDIVVCKLVNPNVASTRADNYPVADALYVSGVDMSNQAVDFSFVLPTGYDGALVTVTFQEGTIVYIDSNTEASAIMNSAGIYKLTDDVNASVFSNLNSTPFTGTLIGVAKADGTFPVISHLRCPLFGTATNATISNIMIKDVAIRQDGPVGAIACTANGTTRIYNCGILPNSNTFTSKNSADSRNSAIASNDNYCGGLVGLLDGTNATDKPRVINCFSYANITGGTVKAGIVGYNNFASKYNNLRTMVMNCMFYGDITTGGQVYPIYGGIEISNDYKANRGNRLNNYNYFCYEAPFSKNNRTGSLIITDYFCALPAEERFLVRFEFYRHLLNSTRELAAWYATDNASNGKGIGEANKMAKWVLDKSVAPYPILKVQGSYPSIVNYAPSDVMIDANNEHRNEGRKLGTLTVNIAAANTWTNAPTDAAIKEGKSQLTLTRTDKDPGNYNFNYDKVQLPYYNDVGTKNYTDNKVVTGWMITEVTNGTQGSYTETNYDSPNYNYADRSIYAKDLYGTGGSNRVFAQGAYFNVPEGVTAITIKPYWGNAVYLSDACYDRYGYGDENNAADDLTQVGGGQRYTNGNTYSINGDGQKVYTTISNALGGLSNASSVYDNAVVLVGNYHHSDGIGGNGNGNELASDKNKAFTIMSIDLNEDNEPDYSLIFRSGKQKTVSPIRYDFINVPAMAMAHKMATHNNLAIPGNCKPLGWFEITTTGLIKFGQFEHSHDGKTLAPLIMMGGVIEQFVSNNTGTGKNFTNKTKYLLFGDNVWFKLLSDGTHADKTNPTPHRPISITGGEYETLYLSGFFKPEATACTDGSGDNNAKCYIDGGKFGEVAGAGQENISGDITWKIDHADIKSFYGGGIKVVSNGSQVTGDLNTTIKNSYVDLFCGGPKFGDMAATKTVTTTADNCTFGTFFGAGYGGTSIYRHRIQNEWTLLNYDWSTWVTGSYDKSGDGSSRGKYVSGKGVSVGYEYEFFGGATGNVARMYTDYASFSLAKVNNVTSLLTGCKVLGNFYGGGSLGAVAGNATSILTDCTVNGSVFGAGYSVQMPTVEVFNTGGFVTPPYYNETTALYENVDLPAKITYTWDHGTVSNNTSALTDGDDGSHIIKTNDSTTGLGTVMGHVTLTIKGTNGKGSLIGTTGVISTGHVYGGGDASAVNGNTTVTLTGNTQVLGNVFGGGNKGVVSGTATVNIE